jgi:hypothetical protein
MTIPEIEELLEETRRLARASDKAQLNMALGVLEVARQLSILNEQLAGGAKVSKAAAGKKIAARNQEQETEFRCLTF